MGLRETLNENPRLTTGITAGIIIVVLAFILWPSGGGGTARSGTSDQQVYFSIDDGKTWFGESVKKVPPFQYKGKDAVRAHIFRAGGNEFCNHLERYTPEAQKKLQGIYDSKMPIDDPTLVEPIMNNGMEVKRPGDAKWVKMSDPNSGKVTAPKPPGGSASDLEAVYP